MLKFTIRRLLYAIPTLFGVTLVIFLLFNVAGGDPALNLAGRHSTAEQITQIRSELGLDLPLVQQYLKLVKQVLTFDWGTSWSSKSSVSTTITNGLGPSLTITLPAFLISLLISIPVALILAYKRNTYFDRVTLLFCLGLLSISSVVYVLVGQYLFTYRFPWFPISGWDPTRPWDYAALPILILITFTLGSDILFFRSVFLQELTQNYVRTARAKGVDEQQMLFRHVLKNALIPIVSLVTLQIPTLILGSLLVESYFSIPGVGGLIFHALQESDFPVIRAATTMAAIFYIFVQLAGDLLFALLDPKVRLNQ